MPKKNKLSVLSDSDEAALKKLSKKKRSEASYGKPDDSDIRNLTALFDLYERHNPGKLRKMTDNYAVEKAFKKPNKDAESKMLFWMPEDLQNFMEEYYPTIWSNRDHAVWFVKNFPRFAA